MVIKGCSFMNRELNWENLKFFIALAQEKRLQKAAKILNSNHTTVYRRIKNFEKEINTRLFESTPSGYFLTTEGDKLYKSTLGLEEKIDEISRAIQGTSNALEGEVCITTTISMANTILPKILLGLKKKYPGIRVDLRVGNELYNLSKREADIAIRPSSDVPDHLIGRKLGVLDFNVYSTPSYLKDRPKKFFMKNINEYDFIIPNESLAHLLSRKWILKYLKNNHKINQCDNLTIVAEMCNSGLGVAVLPEYFEKKFKNLEVLYRPKLKIGSDLWLLTHKDLSQIPYIKVTMKYLAQELNKSLSPYLTN